MKKIKTSSLTVNKLFISIIALFLILVLFKLFFVENHILTDAAYYLMGAENIANGNGFYSYNIGYLQNNDIQQFSTLIPIIQYQPVYSSAIALVIRIFNITPLVASRIINSLSYIVFLFLWINLFRKLFYHKITYYLISVSLLFSFGAWTYILPPHSEMLFIVWLSILGNLVYYWNSQSSRKKQFLFSFLIGLTLILIVLTRYAGISFLISLILFSPFIFNAPTRKLKFINISIIISTFFIIYALWIFRTYNVSGMLSRKLYSSSGSLFDAERVFEIINYFFCATLNLPNSLSSFYPFLFFIILFIIIYSLKFNKFTFKPLNLWIISSFFIYFSMIIYLGLKNRAVDEVNGFYRFLYILSPFALSFIALIIENLIRYNKKIESKIHLSILIVLVSISLLSGINRTRIYFQTLPIKVENTDFYESIKKKASKNDLILSNQWQNVSARTSLPIVQFHFKNDIDSLKNYYRGNYNSVFLVLEKNVGITYRKGVDTWKEVLKDSKYQIIKENEKSIFVKLN